MIKNEQIKESRLKSMINIIVKEEIQNLRQELKVWKQEMIVQISNCIVGKNKSEVNIGMDDTYAQLIKKGVEKESVIILKPKNKQDGDKTREDLKNNITLSELGIGVTKVKKLAEGKIVVGCPTEEEVKKLKNKIENKIGNEYEVMDPKLKKPKIKIVGIEREEIQCEDRMVLDKIIKQNELNNVRIDRHFKMLHKSDNKSKQQQSIIVEIDPETHAEFIRAEKIKLGWRICPVFDFISIIRCYKYWRYGHMMKNYKSELKCKNCGEEHRENECKETSSKCVNCLNAIKNRSYIDVDVNHQAIDRKCPIYVQLFSKMRNKVQYAQKL